MTIYGTYSYRLSKLDFITEYLSCDRLVYAPLSWHNIDIYMGWGYKKYAENARKSALKQNKPYYTIEDGFLRSLYTSKFSKTPLSVVVDKKSIYFDSQTISDLETILVHDDVNDTQIQESHDAMDFFRTHHLSKYCVTVPYDTDICPEDFNENSVLLIDQTLNDASLLYGGIKEKDLPDIIKNSKQKFAGKTIFLKTHPEVISGHKQSCFGTLCHDTDIKLIPHTVSLPTLLRQKPHVVVLTSLAGFEGLIYGCSVTCYGISWYSGYRLTDDMHPDADMIYKRRKKRTLAEIFYLAYIKYPVYINPVTLKRGTFWDTALYLSRCMRHVQTVSGHLYIFGFRPWKRRDMIPFFKTPFNKITYVKNIDHAIKQGILTNKYAKILVWSYKNTKDIEYIQAKKTNIPILRCEDGFIRSYGLGSDFIPPFSIAIDTQDLYFYHDKKNPSDIQTFLNIPTMNYQMERIENLYKKITEHHINKYNIDKICDLKIQTDKQIILLIGQVDDDASLRYGGLISGISGNSDMIEYARLHYPNAFIIYKPHPDVLRGNRIGQIKNKDKIDRIETNASVLSCIDAAHHIISMTSLSGFEGILRGKQVTLLGKPFYHAFAQLYPLPPQKMMDMVRGVFVDYPIYINTDNVDLPYGTPERVIEKILLQKNTIHGFFRKIHIQSRMFKRIYQIKKWIFG